MKVALVRTPVINLRNSPFGSTPGVPSNLAYLVSVLQEAGHSVAVVDSYGMAPHRFLPYLDRFEARGLKPSEAIQSIPEDVEVIGISIHCTLEHGVGLQLIEESKKRFPNIPVVIGGYHTTFCVDPFLENGADYVIQGEGEQRFPMLLNMLENSEEFTLDGLYGHGFASERIPCNNPIEDLPFGNFDPLPLERYWSLHYAHGPVRKDRYLSLFTSRGCPFNCAFCQTPKMWGGNWMAKSYTRVIDEMDHYHKEYGVDDFHIQDENFSLSRERTRKFAEELLRRKRKYFYCFPSGIKAETVGKKELELLYKSGCRYFALSPESASKKVLKLMNKTVDLDHVVKVVKYCHKLGIRVNCNFVLGFPGEERSDRRKTYKYIRKLARLGLDEIVAFMLTPLPSTAVEDLMPEGLEYEDMNFSPAWRDNYRTITRARIWIYIQFIMIKTLFHPLKALESFLAVVTRRFRMKSDMTVYRFLCDLFDRHLRGAVMKGLPFAIEQVDWHPPVNTSGQGSRTGLFEYNDSGRT